MDLTVIDHLLTTTRSVRKRLDLERPVDLAVVRECLEIAIQAPTGGNRQGYHFVIVTRRYGRGTGARLRRGNRQGYHFVIVTDAEKRRQFASYYAQSYRVYLQGVRSQGNVWKAGDPRAERAARRL